MYIWVGIDVDAQLPEIKKHAWQINDALVFENFCTTLPLHISLKMSFPIDDSRFEAVVAALCDYYATLKPFEIPVNGIDNEGCIIWIRMGECAELNRIHDDLNRILGDRFGVGLHEYDCDYKFHTTLFMDDDAKKIDAAYARIKNDALPQTLTAKWFVIGGSENGALGSYSVFRSILIGE